MSELLRSFADPASRHAMLVHVPIVFGLLAFVPLGVLAFKRFRSRPLVIASVVWLLAASSGAFLAAQAGEAAEGRLEDVSAPLSPAEEAALERHESLAEIGWVWPLIPATFAVITLTPHRRIALGAGILSLVSAIGVSIWMTLAAHSGGALVYNYGLGPPGRGVADAAAPAVGRYGERQDDDRKD